MKKYESKEIHELSGKLLGQEMILEGWIKNHRKQKEFGFIDFFDGTHFKSIQIVYDNKLSDFDKINKFHVGSAIRVEGKLIESQGTGQSYEIQASNIILEGDCPEDYPIQPKRHSREFLREQAYLRPRVNLFQAVFRIRSIAAAAIHNYFQERGYVYFHSPIITGSDAEGAGEMFKVTTLDIENIAKNEIKDIDYKKDFFGKKASLTVSGQLQAEAFALAFKKVYTFGPTFRAENSNTKTHASEFWMIEPEIAFTDLDGVMEVEEEMLKYVINYVLTNAKSELEFLDKFVEEGLIKKLENVVSKKAVKITHKEAIKILKESGKAFENTPEYGQDLATEHEKYLTSEHFNSPVFVTDWPKDIKAFYMRLNDDNETVAAVDLLVPGAGELMGGSQREERADILEKRMDEMGVPKEELYWYINLRKFGGCKHGGFGMGFERLLIYITGVENIRDVIPFPRTPNNCEF
ncbi:MAG TPA: asparagine--tRNA ligase [Tenericutes bacterium]|nr:asparagine--tRNA ligase [Mycoplasmatota bacterium]